MADILPQLRAYLNSPYKWMAGWKHRFAKRLAPQDVLEDMEVCGVEIFFRYKEKKVRSIDAFVCDFNQEGSQTLINLVNDKRT